MKTTVNIQNLYRFFQIYTVFFFRTFLLSYSWFYVQIDSYLFDFINWKHWHTKFQINSGETYSRIVLIIHNMLEIWTKIPADLCLQHSITKSSTCFIQILLIQNLKLIEADCQPETVVTVRFKYDDEYRKLIILVKTYYH